MRRALLAILLLTPLAACTGGSVTTEEQSYTIDEPVTEMMREAGVTMLLVEQDAHAALAIADRAYVMEDGRIVAEGPAAELRADPAIRDAYLGGKVAPAPTVRG